MTEHMIGMGKHLHASVGKYNDFVGSLESSVLPQARKFNELEVEGTSVTIPSVAPIATEIREVRAPRTGDVPPVAEHEALSSSNIIVSGTDDGAVSVSPSSTELQALPEEIQRQT